MAICGRRYRFKPPDKTRPVVILSRPEVIGLLHTVDGGPGDVHDPRHAERGAGWGRGATAFVATAGEPGTRSSEGTLAAPGRRVL
jgi:hypothetical protein